MTTPNPRPDPLAAAAPELARALAEIARLTSFCFTPTARDVEAARLARAALTAAGITDPAAWLAAQERS